MAVAIPSRAPGTAPLPQDDMSAPTSLSSDTPPHSGGGRLPHLPALDGLRAVAVLLVVAFHNGFTWMRGGFLGVSVFFTLSGYLITSLLISEHRHTGGVSLRSFWARRFRRLLPASLLAIALAIAYGLFAADPTQRADLAGDVVASLAYVANWWFLASEQTYAALFSAPSPLLHFWSLAIEEQFYLLLPLAAAAAIGRLRRFTIGVVVVLAATLAIPFVTSASDNWLYYATPARLPELLTGVLLAVVLARGDRRNRLTTTNSVILPTVIGFGALGATVWLAATSTIASGWLYRGGFAAFSLMSVALIISAHSPASLSTRLLSLSPMQYLGRISYGVYLYHWPIFLWLDPARTTLEGWPLFGLRMAVTLLLADLSYRYVEMPIRRSGRILGGRPLLGLAPVAVVALVASAVVVASTAPPKPIDFDVAAETLASFDDRGTPGDARPLREPGISRDDTTDVDAILASLPEEPPIPRVALFGDSTALMTGFGLARVIIERPEEMTYVQGVTLLGCGVNLGSERQLRDDQTDTVPRRCRPWQDYWAERVRSRQPDVAVVQVGPWEVMSRRLDADGPFVGPGDDSWDERVLSEMLLAVDRLSGNGAFPMWVTAPSPNRNLDAATHFAGPENVDPARFVHLNSLIRQLPALRPGKVAVVDLADWLASRDDDAELRPDGIHFSGPGGATAARDYLFDEVRRQYVDAWRSGAAQRIVATSIVDRPVRPSPPPLVSGGPLRVAVWSDDRSSEVVDEVTRGAEANGIAVEVEVVGNPNCGVARGDQRRVDGSDIPVDPTCADRTGLARRLAAFDPHVVVLAPGRFEAAEHRAWVDWDQWKIPGDPFINLWLLREFASAIDLAGRTGALVALNGLNPGDAEPYTSAVNNVVVEVSMTANRGTWLALQPASAVPGWAVDRLAAPGS